MISLTSSYKLKPAIMNLTPTIFIFSLDSTNPSQKMVCNCNFLASLVDSSGICTEMFERDLFFYSKQIKTKRNFQYSLVNFSLFSSKYWLWLRRMTFCSTTIYIFISISFIQALTTSL